MLAVVEMVGLTSIGGVAVVVLLGLFAQRFSGRDLLGSLLPFAAAVLAIIAVGGVGLYLWHKLRGRLLKASPLLPPLLVIAIGCLLAATLPRERLYQAFVSYRLLVGGREEAERQTLAHQVYASYRRHDLVQLQRMIDRAQPFGEAIDEAARRFSLDADLLKGVAATESSFLPRPSGDGGQGLFQITRVPDQALAAANHHFPSSRRKLDDPRYNAYVGAATLRHYLGEMKDDLFLGLLAYNIGPANGGLRFIMGQYGATDFVTIQPYLMQLPRDYPIRVLSYALAFRLARLQGRLPAYEEGKNAVTIQRIGIPGM